MYGPTLILVAQGAKQVMLGDHSFVYDRARYLVTSVDVPVVSQIVQASASAPFLAIAVQLDLEKVADLVTQVGPGDGEVATHGPGISTAAMRQSLLEAAVRLVRLLEAPHDTAVMAPLIEREIYYRLISSGEGAYLRNMAVAGSRTAQIVSAISWLKAHYKRPLRIHELARAVNISESALHHHFKAITAMSPLQYQKQLRLQEARRLMLGERLDAASASQLVGYESPSQFSREYRRLYGSPPLRDIAQFRNSDVSDATG